MHPNIPQGNNRFVVPSIQAILVIIIYELKRLSGTVHSGYNCDKVDVVEVFDVLHVCTV
jgi:hypothetical protein